MRTEQASSGVRRPGILDDATKGPGLLFGVLLILVIMGVAESALMLWRGRLPSLVELLVFALLAADAIILLLAVRESNGPGFGWIGLLSVWVLGLIPYFLWTVIYAAGNGVAGWIRRRTPRPPLVAMLSLVGVLVLCSCAYWFASGMARPR